MNYLLPNFLIIGAMKSGTTTLYETLLKHPQVYLSRLKEPNFFSYSGTPGAIINNLEDYQALFREVTDEKAVGEASTTYLFHPKAPKRIHRYIPHVKLIVILRDPADRAYSLYLMKYRNEIQKLLYKQNPLDSFAKVVQRGIGGGLSELYCPALKYYFNLFGREQIKICIYQDLKDIPVILFKDICKFLNVDCELIGEKSCKKANVGGIPKNHILYSYLESLRINLSTNLLPRLPNYLYQNIKSTYTEFKNLNLQQAPPLPPEIRKQIVEMHRDDILQLQDILQRDLSSWLKY